MGKYYDYIYDLLKSVKILSINLDIIWNNNKIIRVFITNYKNNDRKPNLDGVFKKKVFKELKIGLNEINDTINFLNKNN